MKSKDNFNSSDVRTELWAVLHDLRNGKLTPQAALASAKLVQTIVNSARADLEASRFLSEIQTESGNVVPLRLGQG